MPDFRSVTPEFSVAPQLAEADFAAAAAAGFKTVINNRPENESPDQVPGAKAKMLAEAAGLTYHALPFQGAPSPAVVAEMAAVLEASRAGPVLAYCRSGTRSIAAWGMAQALSGAASADEVVAVAESAGYDLSGARTMLQRLAPR